MRKKILCLDFDGVIHSYVSGWQHADFIPDPPVPGAMQFLHDALDHFEIRIFSSRSHQPGGIRAMALYIEYWAKKDLDSPEKANKVINAIVNNMEESFPREKPSAHVTIDDRAITFNGKWPTMDFLHNFRPWNK